MRDADRRAGGAYGRTGIQRRPLRRCIGRAHWRRNWRGCSPGGGRSDVATAPARTAHASRTPSATARASPRTARSCAAATLVDLFEQQVAQTPDAVGAVCWGARMTRADLRARSTRAPTQLAWRLHRRRHRARGPRGPLVWTARPRSSSRILATLKAGAAYVPLDPDTPIGRASRRCSADARARRS